MICSVRPERDSALVSRYIAQYLTAVKDCILTVVQAPRLQKPSVVRPGAIELGPQSIGSSPLGLAGLRGFKRQAPSATP